MSCIGFILNWKHPTQFCVRLWAKQYEHYRIFFIFKLPYGKLLIVYSSEFFFMAKRVSLRTAGYGKGLAFLIALRCGSLKSSLLLR